jgi:trigger factor
MNITVESQPNCLAVLHVEIPSADVKRERETVTTNYARYAKLPGFRPGKAPKAVVAKKFEAEIKGELENALVRAAYQEAAKREDLEILNVQDVKDQKFTPDDAFTVVLEVSTAPKFELPDYKGIPVKLPRIEVTDADIDHEMTHLRERFQTFQDVEREAAMGDYVVLKATASVDGKPVEEAHPDAPAFLKKIDGNWFQLESEEKFLPGFFTALVGIKKDESREVKIDLPEDFPFEAMKGQAVTYQVEATAVKEALLPELNDEFAAKVQEGLTLETLRNELRVGIQNRREQANDTAKTNQVIAHLADKLEFELPQDAVNREAQRRTNDIAMNALRQGMNEDAILEAQPQIVSAATQQARQNVKVSFILEEVAKKEKLKVTEEQLRRALAQIAMRQKVTPKKLLADAKKNNLIERLQGDILMDNAVQFLKQSAQVEETDPVHDDCGHDHSH